MGNLIQSTEQKGLQAIIIDNLLLNMFRQWRCSSQDKKRIFILNHNDPIQTDDLNHETVLIHSHYVFVYSKRTVVSAAIKNVDIDDACVRRRKHIAEVLIVFWIFCKLSASENVCF